MVRRDALHLLVAVSTASMAASGWEGPCCVRRAGRHRCRGHGRKCRPGPESFDTGFRGCGDVRMSCVRTAAMPGRRRTHKPTALYAAHLHPARRNVSNACTRSSRLPAPAVRYIIMVQAAHVRVVPRGAHADGALYRYIFRMQHVHRAACCTNGARARQRRAQVYKRGGTRLRPHTQQGCICESPGCGVSSSSHSPPWGVHSSRNLHLLHPRFHSVDSDVCQA